jgi:hydroxymethylpyrimidine/phosphomethylpyrimidine kinase
MNGARRPPAVALTIAGSDSSGGAGIQADLKTFAAHGVYGASAIAALTAQNTTGVTSVHAVPPAFVAAQIDAVADDLPIAAVKTGMLFDAGIVAAVADVLRRRAFPNLVVDPVMVSKSGARLLEEDAVKALCERLLPLATLVTPNLPEAAVLAGRPVESDEDRREAARRIAGLGARAVLVKGGHATGPEAIDLYYEDGRFEILRSPRQATRHTHGTGCTLSAAIAARLAKGDPLFEAVQGAKEYLGRALKAAPGLGHGSGPLEHFPGNR